MVKKTGRGFATGCPTRVADYKQALVDLQPPLTQTQREMLRLHYHYRDLTSPQLAGKMGWDSSRPGPANSQYGGLGGLLLEKLKKKPDVPDKVQVLVGFDNSEGPCHWIMWENLARALEAAGIVDKRRVGPDRELGLGEMTGNDKHKEGKLFRVTVGKHERNAKARRLCLKHWGYSCKVCGFNFKRTYGLKDAFIHVHHIRPLAKTSKERTVNPEKDLRPVCANCHAAIHRKNPPYSIGKLKQMLKRCREQM